jgi:cytochrome c biogenesis protein ResB
VKKNDGGILKALSSLRLTVVLLLSLAALCLVGTVFPQNTDLVSGGHGRISRIASFLSPYDIFHSVWFMALGFILCLNLVWCMKRRAKLKERSVLLVVLHGSIILIVLGYGLGFMSLDGLMEIPEGQTVSTAVLRNGSFKELGFSVRCDGFTVDYYDTGMPREFVSELSFMKGGQVAGQARVTVNHPAKFSGLSFYQESYRQSLSAAVTVSDGKKSTALAATEGDIIPLPLASSQARVEKVWGDLMHAGPAVKLLIRSPGGARYLWVFKDIDRIKSQVPDLFERVPDFNPSGIRPYVFSLDRIEISYATGIGVKHDPGIPLVAVGGALFLLSLLLVFLVPRTGPNAKPEQGKGDGS